MATIEIIVCFDDKTWDTFTTDVPKEVVEAHISGNRPSGTPTVDDAIGVVLQQARFRKAVGAWLYNIRPEEV